MVARAPIALSTRGNLQMASLPREAASLEAPNSIFTAKVPVLHTLSFLVPS